MHQIPLHTDASSAPACLLLLLQHTSRTPPPVGAPKVRKRSNTTLRKLYSSYFTWQVEKLNVANSGVTNHARIKKV